jgi:hypothetical protein
VIESNDPSRRYECRASPAKLTERIGAQPVNRTPFSRVQTGTSAGNVCRAYVVEGLGFEPRLHGSEPRVLPLDDPSECGGSAMIRTLRLAFGVPYLPRGPTLYVVNCAAHKQIQPIPKVALLEQKISIRKSRIELCSSRSQMLVASPSKKIAAKR